MGAESTQWETLDGKIIDYNIYSEDDATGFNCDIPGATMFTYCKDMYAEKGKKSLCEVGDKLYLIHDSQCVSIIKKKMSPWIMRIKYT